MMGPSVRWDLRCAARVFATLRGSLLRSEDLRYATRKEYNTRMREYYVYILAKKRNGALYIGMAKDLMRRVKRHKKKTAVKFTKDYEINKLVYFEKFKNRQTASVIEQQLKKWNRRWKIRLIEQSNPIWEDLYPLDPRQKTK